MPCLGQAGCVPWGSQGFCRCLFLRVKTGCFLRVKTIYRAFEGSEVAGRKPGQVTGNPAARSGGSSPCLGAVLPPGPQALRLPRADPGVLGTARPARPLPTRREPPVTCRRCWATAPLAPATSAAPAPAAAPAPPAAAWRPGPTPRCSLRASGPSAPAAPRRGRGEPPARDAQVQPLRPCLRGKAGRRDLGQ